MTAYIIRRLAYVPIAMIGVSIIVFLIMYVTPGDPAMMMLGPNADARDLASLRTSLGLDQPVWVQYWIYFKNAIRGDFGQSFIQHEAVLPLILDRMPATFLLTVTSLFLAILVGIPAGVISAIKRYTVADYTVMVGALFGISMPVFWRGLMLILAFALYVRIFPASGYGASFVSRLHHLVLPAVALGMGETGLLARLVRSDLMEVLNEDYVQTARAKGIAERVVIWKHAFRNALIPVVTVIGLEFASLMGGAVLTETVFAWPGVGRLAVKSLLAKDYPVVVGILTIVAFIFIVVNLLVDLTYVAIDPRIRYN